MYFDVVPLSLFAKILTHKGYCLRINKNGSSYYDEICDFTGHSFSPRYCMFLCNKCNDEFKYSIEDTEDTEDTEDII